MAESNKPIVELGVEFVVELLLFFYPYGAEQMNMPHNFWLGLGCWAFGTAIGIRMFWIFPPWAHHLSRLEKGLIAFILVAGFVLAFYKPVMIAYEKRSAELEGKPTPNAPTVNPIPPPKPIERKPTVEANAITIPSRPGKKRAEPAPTPVPPQIINAPNGIAIGAGIVANPTVNNYGPPTPPPALIHICISDPKVMDSSTNKVKQVFTLTTNSQVTRPIYLLTFSAPITHETHMGSPDMAMNAGEELRGSSGFIFRVDQIWFPQQRINVEVHSIGGVPIALLRGLGCNPYAGLAPMGRRRILNGILEKQA